MMQDVESIPKSGLARRLLKYSLPYWRWMLLSLVLILILSGLVNYLPVLIKRITDSCLLNHNVAADERLNKLSHLSWIYLILALGGYSIRYIQGLEGYTVASGLLR
jgi:ABC-type multidrug transport system fused ATPase/permease subunit